MTIRYRKLSSSGDMTFGQGQLNFYQDNSEAVAQAVLTRLKLWTSEWFLDVTEGTPYQVGAFGKNTDKSVNPMIRERILNTESSGLIPTPLVLSIDNYSSVLDRDTRKLNVEATINTIYGSTALSTLIIPVDSSGVLLDETGGGLQLENGGFILME